MSYNSSKAHAKTRSRQVRAVVAPRSSQQLFAGERIQLSADADEETSLAPMRRELEPAALRIEPFADMKDNRAVKPDSFEMGKPTFTITAPKVTGVAVEGADLSANTPVIAASTSLHLCLVGTRTPPNAHELPSHFAA